MGNSDSVPSNKFIVRKKKVSDKSNNNINQNDQIYEQKNNVIKNSQNKNSQNNQNKNNINKNNGISNKNSQNKTHLEYENQHYDQNIYFEPRPEIIQKKINPLSNKINDNNQIIERNMMSEIYSRNHAHMDYPTSSNSEIGYVKKNTEKIEFTPYNINDEVTNFKKGLKEEREAEELRRLKFEKEEKDKFDFLQNQIKKFDNDYNPWEILGLQKPDLNMNNIKKNYKKMALKYHPDRAGEKYNEKFQLITQAYIYLLGKSEEYYELENKISHEVENIDYEDNINKNVENLYVDKDKFDINQFNTIFNKYKIPDTFDAGYADLFNKDIEKDDSENQVFGKKFNNDIFNSHFNNIKTKKSDQLIQYREPEALESTLNSNLVSFGLDIIEDFGSMNNNNLSYTDYKKAHIDENLLIDANKVKFKTYKSIDQLESDRANLSYTPTPEEKRKIDLYESKRAENDNYRVQQQRLRDEMIYKQYNNINKNLIVHK